MQRKQYLESMRRFSLLVLSIFLVLSGCDGVGNDTGPFKVDELEKVESFGQTGVFYQADERSGLEAENKKEAQQLLIDLKENGAEFDAAFFKQPSVGCVLPGSDGSYHPVVVPAQMILRLPEQSSNPKLPSSFEEVKGEASMLCPYNVLRFCRRNP